jgi:K+-transporting ATPase KdpF subunit
MNRPNRHCGGSSNSNAVNLKIMIAIFILCIAMFGYLCYVLIKPEKF